MNKKIAVIGITVLLIGLTMPVIAQTDGNATGNANSGNATVVENTQNINISQSLTLKGFEFYEENGQSYVNIALFADYSQNVLVCDSFAGMNGEGFSNTASGCSDPNLDNGRTVLTIPVTEFQNYRGFSISTGKQGVGYTERTDGITFDTAFSASSFAAMAVGGILIGIGLVFIAAYKRRIDYNEEVERIV